MKKFTATVELNTNDDSCDADLMRMRLRRSITVGAAQLFADGIPLGQVKAINVEKTLSATDAKERTADDRRASLSIEASLSRAGRAR